MYDELQAAARQQSNLVGTASTETEIPAAIAEIQRVGKLVAEVRAGLNAFTDRMLQGDAPQPPTTGEDPKARRLLNGGLTGSLRREIELTTEIAEDALRLTERLRQIG